MEFKFEQIDSHHQRAKVPGGWLVKVFEDVTTYLGEDRGIVDGYNWRIAMTFVPDPKHEWKITEYSKEPETSMSKIVKAATKQ